MVTKVYTIPHAGPARELLREKGQFWTPNWITEAMVTYVLGTGADQLFDPAVGAGAFLRAAKKIAVETGRKLSLSGMEIDPLALEQAKETGLSEEDLAKVELTDFVRFPPAASFKAIVANPPYIRHHRLSLEIKTFLKRLSAWAIGVPLDGRAGLHVYFLIRALTLLAPGGRLSFIMPADTCEGVFAPRLWAWITRTYRLDAVVTFAPEATPFPGVDTNPIIFMISRDSPSENLYWAKCMQTGTALLKSWVLSGFGKLETHEVVARRRKLSEALETGLSRFPIEHGEEGPRLVDFARVMRGIAPGSQGFFFLTPKQAASLQIPQEFLKPV